MEIEKKFTLKSLPEGMENLEKIEIEQAYISTFPTIRLRKWNESYILTIKTKAECEKADGIVINNEVELPLLKEEYESLLESVKGNLIKKTRYKKILEDGKIVEIDVFKGRLEGLIFAEVEFRSIEDATSFVPPFWFDRDVSEDRRYRNTELSKIEDFDSKNFL